jgi:hypothetical protein
MKPKCHAPSSWKPARLSDNRLILGRLRGGRYAELNHADEAMIWPKPSGEESMFGASLTISLSALAILTIPADMAAVREGAQMIVGLQGLCFCIVAAVRGIWWTWSNRADLRQGFRDLVDAI